MNSIKHKKFIYLDNSATTPIDPLVAEKMNETIRTNFGNPSSIHTIGRHAKHLLEESREQVALLLNCLPEEIIFTSGGTEADNLAIFGTFANLPKEKRFVTTKIEHPAVLNSAVQLNRLGYPISLIPPDKFGEVTVEAVDNALSKDTAMLSVMHANNEVGTINDISRIAELAKSKGILFHSDAVQSFGKIPTDVKNLGVDMLSLSAHKIYGPKGVGALFVKKGIEISPTTFGGMHENAKRAGTENLPGIVGLGMAAKICRENMQQHSEYVSSLRDHLQMRLIAELPDFTINGSQSNRLASHLNITVSDVEGESMLMFLDLKGIAISTGSACSSGSPNPSKTLLAMGLTVKQAHSSLRITIGKNNTLDDINLTADELIKAVQHLRGMGLNV